MPSVIRTDSPAQAAVPPTKLDEEASGSLLTSHPTHLDQVSKLDRVAYLFGYPIAHSLSPLLHNTIYQSLSLNWGYFLHESTSIASFLELTQGPKFFGGAVTMPHKVAIIPYLDELTTEGKDIGAINTVFLKTDAAGRRLLVGTNTDCIGIREAIRQNISKEKYDKLEGRPGLIIGGGGTARAAVYAMKKWMKCSKIYFINRDQSEVDAVIAGCVASGFGDDLIYVTDRSHATSLETPGVSISAIPDFPPKTAAELEARECVKVMLNGEPGALLEMCYHPSANTQITALAKSMGWQVVPGVEAMIWQGVEQIRYWTGKDVSQLPVQEGRDTVIDHLTHTN